MRDQHRFLNELEHFLKDFYPTPDFVWPRVRRIDSKNCGPSKVLICGNIVLDLPINIRASYEDFVAALGQSLEKFRAEWELADPQVGGLLGNTAPLAADAGFEVHLSSHIGIPAPAPIRDFLECGVYDTHHVRCVAGPGRGPRLIVSLDKEGAYLLNGKPNLVQLPTLAVENGQATGAGDTLALFATIASSVGLPDQDAAEFGVQAATRRVAGLAMPTLNGPRISGNFPCDI